MRMSSESITDLFRINLQFTLVLREDKNKDSLGGVKYYLLFYFHFKSVI